MLSVLLEMIKKSFCSGLTTVLSGLYFDQTSGGSSAIEDISLINRNIWALALLYLLVYNVFLMLIDIFNSHISF